MSKTKSYRDNLAKSLWSKREETNKKIETIEKSDFLLSEEKKAPIQRIKDALYKELDDVSSSEEYQNAKKEKNEIRNKKKQVKQLRDTLEDLEKQLGEEEKELFNMRETYGDFEPLWLEYAPEDIKSIRKDLKESLEFTQEQKTEVMECLTKTVSYNKDGTINILPLEIVFSWDLSEKNQELSYKEAQIIKEKKGYNLFEKVGEEILEIFSFEDIIKLFDVKGFDKNQLATAFLWINIDDKYRIETSSHYWKKEYIKYDELAEKFVLKKEEKDEVSDTKCRVFGYKKMK